jgi:hypothetical protein
MKTIPSAAAVLFSGADIVLKIVPVPIDYALIVKLPTAMICVFVYLASIKPSSMRQGRLLFIGGVGAMVFYLLAAQSLLYSNPATHRAEDNSTVGLWLTEPAKERMKDQGLSEPQMRSTYSPSNWELLYSKSSQLASVGILFSLYVSTFVLLTVGGKRL